MSPANVDFDSSGSSAFQDGQPGGSRATGQMSDASTRKFLVDGPGQAPHGVANELVTNMAISPTNDASAHKLLIDGPGQAPHSALNGLVANTMQGLFDSELQQKLGSSDAALQDPSAPELQHKRITSEAAPDIHDTIQGPFVPKLQQKLSGTANMALLANVSSAACANAAPSLTADAASSAMAPVPGCEGVGAGQPLVAAVPGRIGESAAHCVVTGSAVAADRSAGSAAQATAVPLVASSMLGSAGDAASTAAVSVQPVNKVKPALPCVRAVLPPMGGALPPLAGVAARKACAPFPASLPPFLRSSSTNSKQGSDLTRTRFACWECDNSEVMVGT
jgi:hypothetical protein